MRRAMSYCVPGWGRGTRVWEDGTFHVHRLLGVQRGRFLIAFSAYERRRVQRGRYRSHFSAYEGRRASGDGSYLHFSACVKTRRAVSYCVPVLGSWNEGLGGRHISCAPSA